MKVDKINSYISKLNLEKGIKKDFSYPGKKEFEELPELEKISRAAVEKFRQNFNDTNINYKLKEQDDDISKYVRFKAMLSNAVETTLDKMKNPWKNQNKDLISDLSNSRK